VLIVDDEPDLLRLAETYLQQLGYRTLTATNAREALALFERHADIDCLFTDIVMPGGIDGFALAERLTSARPDLRVLLTSGFTSRAGNGNGQGARAGWRILRKPYTKSELAQGIFSRQLTRIVPNS